MTKRQQRIAAVVMKHREDIADSATRELASKPIGYSMAIRLCIGFVEGYLSLLVTKVPDGFDWVEQGPWYRKGYAAPKPRPLPL